MADTEATPAAAPAPVKVAKVKKTPKAKKPSSHPPYQQMITEAISSLKEKGGSSRHAIVKYIMKTHKISADTVSNAHLKLALRRGLGSGLLKQSKGIGAAGSFKLGDAEKSEEKAKKPVKKTVKKAKSPKKAAKAKSPAKKAKIPKVAKPAKKVAKSTKKAAKPAAKKATKAAKKAKK